MSTMNKKMIDMFPQTAKVRNRLWICSLDCKIGKDIQPIQSSHGDCPVLDCVPVTDGAYGMVGVALYWDEDRASTIVSFLAADGTSQEAGPAARAVEPPELTYVGEGTVVFLLEKEDGSTTNYALTLSIDGEDVHFEAQEGNMLLLP